MLNFRKMSFFWFLWLFTFFVATRTGKSACFCGYGGSCLRLRTGEPFLFPCKFCDEFSRGYYNSCKTITDHCQSSPCARGRCVPTFGAYYCDCPKDYFGKNCDIFNPLYANVGISNEVNAYHQFQPDSRGMSWFHIMYDPKDAEIWKKYDTEIRVNVTVGDGRRYFPLKNEHFERKNIREMCLKESSSQPEAYDARVCDYLPEGRKWTFTVDTTLYAFGHMGYREFKSPEGNMGVIANFSMLTIQVQAITKGRRDVLYEHSYSVFSYVENENFQQRTPHRCRIEIDFRECSTDRRHPRLYTPGEEIYVNAIHRHTCTGVTDYGRLWYIQRNLNREEETIYDPVPNHMQEFDNEMEVTFPPRYIPIGLHMFQLEYKLRGEPPNWGGTEEFTIFGACWIEVIGVMPILGFAYGNRRFASCHRPFKLEVVSYDNNYSPSEFNLVGWCSDQKNKECDYRNLPGSVWTLNRTPCDKTYSIQLKLEHRQYDRFGPALLEMEVKFVRTEVDLLLECLHNCHLINPEFRTVLAARTEVYSPGRVRVRIGFVGGKIVSRFVAFGGDANSLDGTSRVVRLSGQAFDSMIDSTARLTYNVSKGDRGFCEYGAKVVNLNHYIADFKLIDLKNGWYKFERPTPSNPRDSFLSGIFYPMNFLIYSVDSALKVCFIEVDTFHERFLTFKPHYDEVQFCLRAPVHTMYAERCTPMLDVKVENTTRLNIEEIHALIEAGDTRQFLSTMALYLTSDLKKTNSMTLQWTLSLAEREAIVAMCTKALATELSMQADDLFAITIINAFMYSKAGCKDQGIDRTFIDEKLPSLDVQTVAHRLRMSFWAIRSLKIVIMRFSKRINSATFKLRNFPHGSMDNLALQSLALAHFRKQYERTNLASRNIRMDYILAEKEYWATRIREQLYETFLTFSAAMGLISHSFEGLRHAGRGSTHAWWTRSTYDGVLTFLNKSRKPIEPLDDEYFVDYFFATKKDAQPWVKRCGLRFPPVPEEWKWKTEIFSMTVIAVKPQQGNFRIRAPIVFVDVRRQIEENLEIVHRLPGNLTYTVTLPTMVGGKLIDHEHNPNALWTAVVLVPHGRADGSEPNRNFVVHKITFGSPLKAATWHFLLAFNPFFSEFTPANLKVKIFYDHPPEYEDVVTGEWYNFTETPYSFTPLAIFVPVVPPRGEDFIPNEFYMGIIPSQGMPEMRFRSIHTLTTCYVLETDPRMSSDCELKMQIDHLDKIVCKCEKFGIIETRTVEVNVRPYAALKIRITVMRDISMLARILTCLLLFAFASLLFVYGRKMERRRNHNVVQYVIDSNPLDKHLLLVGVQTGINPLSGTLSKVAIKIIGIESSSRVHILEAHSRRSLLPGNDDWFLIPTRTPMGKILSVTIWLNYRFLSDWYCSHIWICDFDVSTWYLVRVGQWMRMSPTTETSQQYHFAAQEIDDEVFTDEERHPEDKFSTYYFRELRNRHLPLSIFYLHNRCVTTFSQRAAMYVVRVLSINALVWVMLEHIAELLFSKCNLEPKALTSVTLNTTLMIFLVTAASRPFTLIPELVYRTSMIPRVMQRRMTYHIFGSSSTDSQSSKNGSKDSKRLNSQRKSRGFSTASSLKSRQIHNHRWAKKHSFIQTSIRAIPTLLFGPAQYRSLNVGQELLTGTNFQGRAVKTVMVFRVMVAIMIISLYGFIINNALTNHSLQRFVASLFLFFLCLLFDALILEPAVIFIRSIVAFVFLKMSIAERNWWAENSKYVIWPKRPKMDFVEYLGRVTEQKYKPPSSQELNDKRNKKFRWDLFKTLAFYSLLILIISTAWKIITMTTPPVLYDLYRLMRASFEEPTSNFGFPGIAIKNVVNLRRLFKLTVPPYSPILAYPTSQNRWLKTEPPIKHLHPPCYERAYRSATKYLLGTMAEADTVWPNEKYVRKVRRRESLYNNVTVDRAGKGRSYMLLGSSKIVSLFLSQNNDSESIIPIEFDQVFEHAHQYLSEGGQLTHTLVSSGHTFSFDAMDTGSFNGASREAYSRKGHIAYIRLDPWKTYYTKLRRTLNGIFLKREIPRAVIFMTNYFCPNIPSVTSIDVIIERLPSGVYSAKLDIESLVGFTNNYLTARYSWTMLAIAVIILGTINVYLICEVGLNSITEDFKIRLRQWFWFSCFIYAGFGAVTRLTKYRILNEMAGDTMEYTDFHEVLHNEDVDSKLCALVVFVGVVELVMLVNRTLAPNRFRMAFYSATRLTGKLLLLMIYICTVYQSAHLEMSNQPSALFHYLTLGEMYPISPENLPYCALSFILVVTVAIATKFSTAMVLCRYFEMKEKSYSRRAVINKRHLRGIRDQKWIVDLKKKKNEQQKGGSSWWWKVKSEDQDVGPQSPVPERSMSIDRKSTEHEAVPENRPGLSM